MIEFYKDRGECKTHLLRFSVVQNVDFGCAKRRFFAGGRSREGRVANEMSRPFEKSDKKRAVDDEKFGKYFFGIWAVFFRKYS